MTDESLTILLDRASKGEISDNEFKLKIRHKLMEATGLSNKALDAIDNYTRQSYIINQELDLIRSWLNPTIDQVRNYMHKTVSNLICSDWVYMLIGDKLSMHVYKMIDANHIFNGDKIQRIYFNHSCRMYKRRRRIPGEFKVIFTGGPI